MLSLKPSGRYSSDFVCCTKWTLLCIFSALAFSPDNISTDSVPLVFLQLVLLFATIKFNACSIFLVLTPRKFSLWLPLSSTLKKKKDKETPHRFVGIPRPHFLVHKLLSPKLQPLLYFLPKRKERTVMGKKRYRREQAGKKMTGWEDWRRKSQLAFIFHFLTIFLPNLFFKEQADSFIKPHMPNYTRLDDVLDNCSLNVSASFSPCVEKPGWCSR